MFCLGEFHVVLAFLKAIGKYIENSGLDQVFNETGIYASTTLNQILKGKNTERAVEAYVFLFLALCKLYLDQPFKKNIEILNKFICFENSEEKESSIIVEFEWSMNYFKNKELKSFDSQLSKLYRHVSGYFLIHSFHKTK